METELFTGIEVVQYLALNGYFGFFEVGFCEVLINCQCLTYSRCWSVHSQCGEPAGLYGTEAKQYTAVDGASSKNVF